MDENHIFDDIDADVNHFDNLFPDLNFENRCLYYDSNEFNTNVNYNKDNFSLMNLNIRSISANIDTLNAFLSSLCIQFDILCFTESWLNSSTKDLIHFNNYDSEHTLRPSRRGGGVSIFIKNSISYQKLESCCLSLPFIESLFIYLEFRGKKIIIANIYRPPNSNNDLFIDKLNELIQFCNNKPADEFILCGDFNYNLIDSEDRNVMNFHNTLNSFSLIPLISKPTRITENSATLIDNICIKNPIDFKTGILSIDLSDHLPIFLIKENFFQVSEPSKCRTIRYRIINEETLKQFFNRVSEFNFDDIYNNDDCAVSLSMFDEVLHEIYNECCPIKSKTISPKRLKKPWISNKIISYIKKRQNYFLLFKQNKIRTETYHQFRNFVTSQIRRSKKSYYLNLFEKHKSDTKATWRAINDILKPAGKHKSQSIKKLLLNNETFTEKLDMANILNNFFCNIGSEISKKYNNISNHENYNHLSFLNNNYCNSFFFRPCI